MYATTAINYTWLYVLGNWLLKNGEPTVLKVVDIEKRFLATEDPVERLTLIQELLEVTKGIVKTFPLPTVAPAETYNEEAYLKAMKVRFKEQAFGDGQLLKRLQDFLKGPLGQMLLQLLLGKLFPVPAK